MSGVVLSLCDRTGNMVRPWAEAGYECYALDIQHPPNVINVDNYRSGGSVHFEYADVTKLSLINWPEAAIVFAFPPCTHLAVSGARHFQAKGLPKLIEALQIVNACREIAEGSGAPYMIENPVSTLSTYWRKPEFIFDPCEYGGYLDPIGDTYTKKTCLWTGGGFVMPEKKPVAITHEKGRSPIHLAPPSPTRADDRSATPKGFARAVFEANHEIVQQRRRTA